MSESMALVGAGVIKIGRKIYGVTCLNTLPKATRAM